MEVNPIRPASPRHSKSGSYSGFKQFGVRAFKTFIQGGTGALMASGLLNKLDISVLESAAIGGFAALISFLNNWAAAAEQPKPVEKG